ncbi:MAG: hypothetical protein ACJ0TD_05140, partial [Arenicellales bacterium]
PAPALEPKERLARYLETATLLEALVGQSDTTLRGLIDQLQEKDASWNGITFAWRQPITIFWRDKPVLALRTYSVVHLIRASRTIFQSPRSNLIASAKEFR